MHLMWSFCVTLGIYLSNSCHGAFAQGKNLGNFINSEVILKCKKTFYLTWIIFLPIKHKLINFDWTLYVTWINFLLLKHKLKKFWLNFSCNMNDSFLRKTQAELFNCIAHNLLITYLNLIKEPIQKQQPIGVFRVVFLKIW